MAETIEIGILNDQYEITSSDTAYQLAYGDYILQTKNGFGGIRENAASQNNAIQIDGAIGSFGQGGCGVEINGLSTTLHVSASGSIDAQIAILTYGDSAQITNDGQISGMVELVGANATTFVNNGILNGAFYISYSDKCNVEFGGNSALNSDQAIKISGQAKATTYITNYGSVTGSDFAFSSGDGDETLVNRGTLKGAISLGAGNDLFDNRLGSVDHVVAGGLGNDTFVIDTKIAISELSGEGTDTVKSAISMNLSTGALHGQSLERLVLTGVVAINGSGNALANTIVGNSQDNRLSGLGGADVLSGGKGNDVLVGGTANDKLTGGLGADTFVFNTGYGHDTITDFENTADHIDIGSWGAITGFKDLLSYHLSVSGDNVIIHAGADELIFQHTAKAELHASDFMF
jgi:Ca2+-binding RTX toxin-like protein